MPYFSIRSIPPDRRCDRKHPVRERMEYGSFRNSKPVCRAILHGRSLCPNIGEYIIACWRVHGESRNYSRLVDGHERRGTGSGVVLQNFSRCSDFYAVSSPWNGFSNYRIPSDCRVTSSQISFIKKPLPIPAAIVSRCDRKLRSG